MAQEYKNALKSSCIVRAGCTPRAIFLLLQLLPAYHLSVLGNLSLSLFFTSAEITGEHQVVCSRPHTNFKSVVSQANTRHKPFQVSNLLEWLRSSVMCMCVPGDKQWHIGTPSEACITQSTEPCVWNTAGEIRRVLTYSQCFNLQTLKTRHCSCFVFSHRRPTFSLLTQRSG